MFATRANKARANLQNIHCSCQAVTVNVLAAVGVETAGDRGLEAGRRAVLPVLASLEELRDLHAGLARPAARLRLALLLLLRRLGGSCFLLRFIGGFVLGRFSLGHG